MTGPTPSSPQQYLNFYLDGDGRKLMVRFYMNSATQHAEWMAMLQSFIRACGADPMTLGDTEKLNGCTVNLTDPGPKVTALAGLASVGAALGIKDGASV